MFTGRKSPRSIINRVYYAMFYAVLALLIFENFDGLVKSRQRYGKVKSSPALRGTRRAIPQMDFLRSHQSLPFWFARLGSVMLSQDFLNKIKRIFSRSRKIEYVFLFGSSLKKLTPESDVDFLIGGDLSFSERADLTMKLALALKRNVDIVLSHEAPCELVMNALSRGMPMVVNQKEKLKEDYFKKYYLFEQNRGLRECRTERVKRRYKNG